MVKRINNLINECLQNPLGGIGNPEALRFDMAGYWSRRIDTEHRLVYKVENDSLIIIQRHYHY
jgi:toxin YoeB